MLQRITDAIGLALAAMLLLFPTIVFFAIAEALLWCMLYFTQ